MRWTRQERPKDEQRKRVDEAQAWVLDNTPDLCFRPGCPCPYAIDAAMNLRREGQLSVLRVRWLRAKKMRRAGLAEFVDHPRGVA